LDDLSLRRFGSGAPVLLLGGNACPVEHLHPLAERLARKRTVLLPSFPGYHAGPPVDRIDLDDQHAALQERIVADGILEIDVVGFSLGAYRACAIACDGRLVVRRVVALAGFVTMTDEERATFAGFAEMAQSKSAPPGILAERFLSPAFAAAHPDIRKSVDSWLDAIEPISLAAELRAIARCRDLSSPLQSLEARVVARVGELDVAAPRAKSEHLVACARHATLEIVPGAGHLLLFEDFENTATSIERALDAAVP